MVGNMTDSTQLTSRETLDVIIQRTVLIYRWAVVASFAFIGFGFALTLFTDQTIDNIMRSPSVILQQVADLHASGFFGIGIGIMILTPIVMIANAAIIFLESGDKRYGLITTAVSTILLLSIVISFLIG